MKQSKTSEEHKHDFTKKLVRVNADNPNYKGESKGLLLAECKCGSEHALDYGDYSSLVSKL